MLAISEEEAQKILNYLVAKPYQEVHELVSVMLKLPRVDEGKVAAKETTDGRS